MDSELGRRHQEGVAAVKVVMVDLVEVDSVDDGGALWVAHAATVGKAFVPAEVVALQLSSQLAESARAASKCCGVELGRLQKCGRMVPYARVANQTRCNVHTSSRSSGRRHRIDPIAS